MHDETKMCDRSLRVPLRRVLLVGCLAIGGAAVYGAEPIQQHPDNPHYLLFRDEPTVLITLAEHYAAVIHLDFDYVTYLDELQSRGFNLTRTFAYWRSPSTGASHLEARRVGRYCAPWSWSSQAGGFDGRKFDLDQWNPEYFARLTDFIEQAGARGVVVELVLFCRMYNAPNWMADAFSTKNNVNGIGQFDDRFRFFTLLDDALIQRQKAYVTKLVQTCRDFDNVYFEICNEPPTDKEMIGSGHTHADLWKWHQAMIQTVRDAESDLDEAQRHRIAVNPMHGNRDTWDDHIELENIAIINRHYNNAMTNVWGNRGPDYDDYARNKICSLDEGAYINVPNPETHHHPATPDQQRVEFWMYLCSGGGIYNGLAKHTYTLADPAGNSPDGIILKGYMQHLISFMNGLNFIKMYRDKGLVRCGVPAGATWRAISEHGQQYLLYLCHIQNEHGAYYRPVPGEYQADLSVHLHASATGRYRAEWINTQTGKVIDSEEFDHVSDADKTLSSPRYSTDIALRILAQETTK